MGLCMNLIDKKESYWDAEDTILVPSIDSLKAVVKHKGIVWIEGHLYSNDGGFAAYVFDSLKNHSEADGTTTVIPNDFDASVPEEQRKGCWIRLNSDQFSGGDNACCDKYNFIDGVVHTYTSLDFNTTFELFGNGSVLMIGDVGEQGQLFRVGTRDTAAPTESRRVYTEAGNRFSVLAEGNVQEGITFIDINEGEIWTFIKNGVSNWMVYQDNGNSGGSVGSGDCNVQFKVGETSSVSDEEYATDICEAINLKWLDFNLGIGRNTANTNGYGVVVGNDAHIIEAAQGAFVNTQAVGGPNGTNPGVAIAQKITDYGDGAFCLIGAENNTAKTLWKYTWFNGVSTDPFMGYWTRAENVSGSCSEIFNAAPAPLYTDILVEPGIVEGNGDLAYDGCKVVTHQWLADNLGLAKDTTSGNPNTGVSVLSDSDINLLAPGAFVKGPIGTEPPNLGPRMKLGDFNTSDSKLVSVDDIGAVWVYTGAVWNAAGFDGTWIDSKDVPVSEATTNKQLADLKPGTIVRVNASYPIQPTDVNVAIFIKVSEAGSKARLLSLSNDSFDLHSPFDGNPSEPIGVSSFICLDTTDVSGITGEWFFIGKHRSEDIHFVVDGPFALEIDSHTKTSDTLYTFHNEGGTPDGVTIKIPSYVGTVGDRFRILNNDDWVGLSDKDITILSGNLASGTALIKFYDGNGDSIEGPVTIANGQCLLLTKTRNAEVEPGFNGEWSVYLDNGSGVQVPLIIEGGAY